KAPLDQAGTEARAGRRLDLGASGFLPSQGEYAVFDAAPGDRDVSLGRGQGAVLDGVGRKFVERKGDEQHLVGVDHDIRAVRGDPLLPEATEGPEGAGHDIAEARPVPLAVREQVVRLAQRL